MRTKRKWTKEEIKFLKENYKNLPNKKIAKMLDRTVNAVQNEACILFLSDGSRRGKKVIKKSKKVKKITLPKTIDKTALVTLILVILLVIFNLILLIGG